MATMKTKKQTFPYPRRLGHPLCKVQGNQLSRAYIKPFSEIASSHLHSYILDRRLYSQSSLYVAPALFGYQKSSAEVYLKYFSPIYDEKKVLDIIA